ncbi:MAG: hypothetical protein Kow0059_21430 [Candidatus Sumerlaeia bacterium]
MLGLSQTLGYAIKALCCVPEPDGCPVAVKNIAACTNIPRPYLAKLIHKLSKAGVIKTIRGNRGGVLLSRPSREIALLEIIRIIEGEDVLNGCLLGMTYCEDKRSCPTHRFWNPIRKKIEQHLMNTTLDEVVLFERKRLELSCNHRNGRNRSKGL